MRIQPDALIAGFPANRIRELLRQSDDFLSCHHARKILGLDGNKARYLLDRLDQEGALSKETPMCPPPKPSTIGNERSKEML